MYWLDVLAAECAKHGQAVIGKKLGYSKATISQVLNGKYPGDLERFQRKVEAALMNRSVDCPYLGEISLNVCLAHQARKFSITNPMRVQMYRACRQSCPHSKLENK